MDNSNAVVRPPLVLALAIVVGLGLNWIYPLPFVPASVPGTWIGGVVFAAAFALVIWAITTIRRAGTAVETVKPTTAIVSSGPFGFTRNPIYLGMLLGLVGIAIAFNTLWIIVTLIAFYFVLRYGVVAREEAYLEGKFGRGYLDYKDRVRRWV
jgi:protein-S-isoprenylcysteine O-methyltransferase Ste14